MTEATKRQGAGAGDIRLAEVDVRDILAAMSQSDGYLDITPDDALALYRLAYGHAKERLLLERTAGAVMTSPVHTADPDLPAPELAQLMARHTISGLPVVRNGVVVGVVSIKDFLPHLGLPKQATPMALVAALLSGEMHAPKNPQCPSALGGALSHLTAGDLMSAPPLCIPPSCPVGEAARLMDERGINRLPVLENGTLVGLLSRTDIIRAVQTGSAPE